MKHWAIHELGGGAQTRQRCNGKVSKRGLPSHQSLNFIDNLPKKEINLTCFLPVHYRLIAGVTYSFRR